MDIIKKKLETRDLILPILIKMYSIIPKLTMIMTTLAKMKTLRKTLYILINKHVIFSGIQNENVYNIMIW